MHGAKLLLRITENAQPSLHPFQAVVPRLGATAVLKIGERLELAKDRLKFSKFFRASVAFHVRFT